MLYIRKYRDHFRRGIACAAFTATVALAAPANADFVAQTNLVTDNQAALAGLGFDPALFEDRNLINPWGVSNGPGGPFWISNQGTGTTTLHTGSGAPFPLVVTIPQNAAGPAGPTGQVFTGGSNFPLPGGPGLFFFANLDGSISGWNQTLGPNAFQVVPPSNANRPAVYTGLATGSFAGSNFLYAANNLTGRVDMFNSAYAPVNLPGAFIDPLPNPAGLAPFNVQNLGGLIYVTYAVPGPSADEAPLGSGFVSVFNTDGTFIRRLTQGGALSSPWGMAIAPAGFLGLGGSLLVGNFSDEHGQINAFSLADGSLLRTLNDAQGDPITIPYLWSLTFGNGALGASPDALYFAAGIGDEEHGLFGQLTAVPEPYQWVMMLAGFGLLGWQVRRDKAGTPRIA